MAGAALLPWLSIVAPACAPALDWRAFEPEGFGIRVSFPCRPDRSSRPVLLAGVRTSMTMLSCEADGQTFAVGYVDADDPARVRVALASLRQAAIGNVDGAATSLGSLALKGMTANAASGVIVVDGRLSDGRPVRLHLALFAKALRAFQAVVIGRAPGRDAVDTFFGGLEAAH